MAHIIFILVLMLSTCVYALEPLTKAVFQEKDLSRKRIDVSLTPLQKFIKPTDIQFVPGQPWKMVVLEQAGKIWWVSLKDSSRGLILSVSVVVDVEMGLLGMAFHPKFPKVPKIYINYNPRRSHARQTRISEWTLDPIHLKTMSAKSERVLLTINQPSPNHKGGQLVFGSDGYLYIGLGDGGPPRGDPHNNGQRLNTLLGKILRIDVNEKAHGKQYSIPSTNPFINRRYELPEIWALGFRNPWRISFDPKDRLIVADVGEVQREELDIVEAGKNYGWSIKEGHVCFKPTRDCASQTFASPWLEYDRVDGGCVIGGYVYTGNKITALKGKYIFGDFISGRLWAVSLLVNDNNLHRSPELYALGKWPWQFSSFGRDADGEIYVADYTSGMIFRVDPF
ncbi:MAG: PQQ-dependent sugar dehydrogenase [Bdellovibrio sp.]|nr:PQQ-dependent sugar dehydrogenase [Bdellovibrio sp.]